MNDSDFEKIVNIASKDTKKGAEIVAKNFYRILRKNGFSEEQIIGIATNLIDCLTESLKGCEHKIAEKRHEEDMTSVSSKFSRFSNK